jgi:AcrR family transcriptional regulator
MADGAREGVRTSRDGRREAILDLASRHLNASGVSLGSIAEIAGLLGVTRAALYGYVEDRTDLIFQCYLRACGILDARLADARRGVTDPFEVIGRFISNVMDPVLPEAAAISELGCLRPDQQAQVEAQRDHLVDALVAVLTHDDARGRVRALDPRVVAQAILSLVYWLKLAPRWLAEEALLPRARLEAAARTLLFEGLATTPVEIPTDTIDLRRLSPQVRDAFDRKALATAKVDQMLATASRLFNQRGVDTTSVDDIAAALGVAKRTVYNHFPDKPALISACQLRGYRIFTQVAVEANKSPGRGADALGAAYYASVICSFQPQLCPLRVFSGLPQLAPQGRAPALRATLELQSAYSEIMNRGISDGSLRVDDQRSVQLAMAGASGWVGAFDDVHPELIAQQLATLVLRGLRAD